MDLRKFTKKSVDAHKVLRYKYTYYSYSQSKYGQPILNITLEESEGTAFSPGYELMLKFDGSGKIIEIMRLIERFGSGSVIKKFPAEVEEKAENILNDVVIPLSNVNVRDWSVLHDSYRPPVNP